MTSKLAMIGRDLLGEFRVQESYTLIKCMYIYNITPASLRGMQRSLPLATILCFFHFHQFPHTRSPVSGPSIKLAQFDQETY
jgi:hypothetical protein